MMLVISLDYGIITPPVENESLIASPFILGGEGRR